jgi:pimeloyl-ACP methyl ester carboxylesterase
VDPEIDALEAVIQRAGGPVHLVGHSFGGSVAIATSVRGHVPIASLSIVEAPLVPLLRHCGEDEHFATFNRMTDVYFAAFRRGEPEAIAEMIDFYGGAGTFASWPARLRAYAIDTAHVNILDWACGHAFPENVEQITALEVPTLVMWGGASPRAVQRANELLAEHIPGASRMTVGSAAHFMIATHAAEVAEAVAQHVGQADQAAAA